MFETTLTIFVFILVGIWIISLFVNVVYFISNKPNEVEKACFNKNQTFDEAFKDLELLERIKACRYNSARNKIAFNKENARLTKRKYYSDRIEEGFIRLYLGRFLTKREVFNKLDTPVKFHFSFVLSCCALVLIVLTLYFLFLVIAAFSINLFLIGSLLIAFFVYFFIHIISINCAVFYAIINLIVYEFGTDRSKLFKNTGILNFLTSKWQAFNTEGMVISAATIGSFHSYSGGGASGFGGFGGGSFGGGGAGGSW